MSEYQYYEFLAIDKPLSENNQEELGYLSTRARISSTSFTNEYHFGDFRGNPLNMMEKYFDAFMYFANWGTHWFMLRIPANLIDLDLAREYCVGDSAVIHEVGQYLIFEFVSENDEYEWEEEGGCLASLISLRSDLIRGDYRSLYLAWLRSSMIGEVDENSEEPPVPPNLGRLNSSLKNFADFMRIDADLIDVAAENSITEQIPIKSEKQLKAWIDELSLNEKDQILFRLVSNDGYHIGSELLQRFKRQLSENNFKNKVIKLRTVAELIQKSERIAEERRRRAEEEKFKEKVRREKEAARVREKYLKSLSKHENELWEKINFLILTKQPNSYDKAVQLIVDLRDVAEINKTVNTFKAKFMELLGNHSKKTSLLRRIDSAGLANT